MGMSRSKGFWDNVNKDMANFDEAVKKSHAEMDMSIAPFRPQLPSWAIPDTVNDEVIKVTNDDQKFEVTLDVSEYKPEELKVTTVNNTLAIEGKHESHKSDQDNTPMSTASGSSHV